jgi:hypothetical protein
MMREVDFQQLVHGSRFSRGRRRHKMPVMTIIVGAFCVAEPERALVLAADRVTVANDESDSVCYERPDGKITILSNAVVVAFAGRVQHGAGVLARAREEIAGGEGNGKRVAEAIRDAYAKVWQEKWLWLEGSRPPQASKEAPGWDLVFLVAAIYNDVPHFWTIDTDGLNPQDSYGFIAIGGGTPKAIATLNHWGNLKVLDLETVVYATYEAKRFVTLNTRGFKEETDMVVLRRGHTALQLSPEQVGGLDRACEIMRPRQLTDEARKVVGEVLRGAKP